MRSCVISAAVLAGRALLFILGQARYDDSEVDTRHIQSWVDLNW